MSISLPFVAEPVFDRQLESIKMNFTGVRRILPHLLLNAADPVSGPRGLHDKGADAALARTRISDGKDKSKIGVLARGDELLCAIEHVAISPSLGSRPQRRGI